MLSTEKSQSGLWRLDVCDFFKGAILFVFATVVSLLIEQIKAGWHFNWEDIVTTAAIAFLSYLFKNLTTDDRGKWLGRISVEKNTQGQVTK